MSNVLPVEVEPQGTAPTEASTSIQGRSLTAIAWSRLRRDKVGMFALGLLIFLFLIAVFAPLIYGWVGTDPYTTYPDQTNDFGFPGVGEITDKWGNISAQHPFGIEPQLPRDVFARILLGARYSLGIALAATVLGVGIGVFLGILAGFRGGWIDAVVGRGIDILLAFPVLLFSIAFLVVISQSPTVGQSNAWRVGFLVFIIGFFGWPYVARVVRGQVLSLREKEFVDAARSVGASNTYILFRELLPNLFSVILVYSSLVIPANILAEAALSYLGVGLIPPTPSWGQMLSDSRATINAVPGYTFFAGMAIFITVLAFNLFGDALSDAFDPKGSRR